MFKNEIKFITDLNVNKLNNKNKLVSLDDIKKSNVHPAIVKYITAYVEQQIFYDVQRLNKNSTFDYSGSKISKYLRLIGEDVKHNKNFNFEETTNLINKAVVFNINFLTRPNKTLVEFIFGEDTRKNISEITQNLLFVYYYRFLPKILLAYLTKKKIKAISKVEFSILLRKIDALARKNHLQGTINTAINSMVNFFDVSSIKAEKLPVQAVELFLKEKGLKSYYKKLNKEFSNDDSKVYLGLVIKDTLSAVTEEALDVDDEKNANTLDEVENIRDKNEAIEIEVDETQIPNEELLSNNNDLTKQDKVVKTDSTDETIDAKIEDQEKTAGDLTSTTVIDNIFDSNNLSNDEENSKIIIDNSNLVDAKEKIESVKEILIEDPKTVKPDVKKAIRELVDISKLFNSLSNEPKPSTNEMLKSSITEDFNITSNKLTDYKIDISDLDTEFNIPNETEKSDENLEFQSIYAKDEDLIEEVINENDNITKNVLDDSEIDIEQFSQTEDRKKVIDEYIDDIKEEKNVDDLNIIDEPIHTSKTDYDSAIDNDITLSEEISEEITEVFSDITYLEKDEIEDAFDEEITETKIEEKSNIEEKTENESISDLNNFEIESGELPEDNNEDTITEVLTDTKTTTTYKTFSEVVVENDMSTMIETIFDYDMEDYQDMIANIGNSISEPEAIQLVNNYCLENSVSLSMTDVASFKSLISNYYSQHQA